MEPAAEKGRRIGSGTTDESYGAADRKIREADRYDDQKMRNGDELTIALAGRLDTNTAPDLELELKGSIGDVKELVFDMEKLEYVSSAGLRVLLYAQKVMNRQGRMVITHVNETISEIFEITGFSDILTVE